MQYLLQHRADPRLRDKRGFTAIHYAVAGGNKAALEALLNASSSPSNLTASLNSSTGQEPSLPALTPIHLAVRKRKRYANLNQNSVSMIYKAVFVILKICINLNLK